MQVWPQYSCLTALGPLCHYSIEVESRRHRPWPQRRGAMQRARGQSYLRCRHRTQARALARERARWQLCCQNFCQSFANLFLRVFGFKGAQARTRWKTVQVWPQRPRGIRLNDCTALRDGYEMSRKLVQIVSGFQSHFTRSPDARGWVGAIVPDAK